MIEPEFHRMVPSGVTVHATKILTTGPHAGDIGLMVENVRRAAEELAAAKVDVITYACFSTTLAMGMDWEAEVVDDLQRRYGLPVKTAAAAAAAASGGFTGYTPNAGFETTRRAFCSYLAAQYPESRRIDADQVIGTPGAVFAMAGTLFALLNPGDGVLVPDPGWPNYSAAISLIGGVAKGYPLDPDNNFEPNWEKLEQLASNPSSKVLILNTPSNPTGACFSKEVVRRMLALARKYDLYVLSDEIYDFLVYNRSHASPFLMDADDRVIGVFGVSKTFAMTGWRIGFVVAPPAIAEIVRKMQEPFVSCAPSVSQKAAEAARTGALDAAADMRDTYRVRRDRVVSLLSEEGLLVGNPDGAFYALVNVSGTGMTGREFALELLAKEHVATAPGDTFGQISRDMVRISFATAEDELVEGVRRLVRFAKEVDA